MQFITIAPMIHRNVAKVALLCGVSVALAACENGEGFNLDFLKKKPETEAAVVQTTTEGGVIEQDVEAPEVFSVNENGLWDGRPSLGGVWVAYPDVKDPERVIIRNADNGKSIVGALFRRERLNPGPKLQVSSDAAVELGMLAGQPAKLSVVALKKEKITPPPVVAPVEGAQEADVAAATAQIDAKPLDPVDVASSAIERAAPSPKPAAAAAAAAAVPAAAPATKTSSLPNPFIQIGTFSNKANADAASDTLRKAGIIPTTKVSEGNSGTLHRVLVGPASDIEERKTLLSKVQGLGFTDVYFANN